MRAREETLVDLPALSVSELVSKRQGKMVCSPRSQIQISGTVLSLAGRDGFLNRIQDPEPSIRLKVRCSLVLVDSVHFVFDKALHRHPNAEADTSSPSTLPTHFKACNWPRGCPTAWGTVFSSCITAGTRGRDSIGRCLA